MLIDSAIRPYTYVTVYNQIEARAIISSPISLRFSGRSHREGPNKTMESSNAFSALADEGEYGDDGEPTPPQPRSPRALTGSGLQRLTPNSRAILAARAARSRLTRSSQDQQLQPAVDPRPSYADVLNASLGARGQTQPQPRSIRPAPSLEQPMQAAQASSNATGQVQTSDPQGPGELVNNGATPALDK